MCQSTGLWRMPHAYVVLHGLQDEIIIVDEFTGRTMPGRRWGEGLHQAVEAKEGVPIQDETITLASISYQVTTKVLLDDYHGLPTRCAVK